MNDALLKKLIDEADLDPPVQTERPFELAARVPLVYRRRRRRKLAIAAAALVGLAGVFWHGLAGPFWHGFAGRPNRELAKSVPVDDAVREARKQIEHEESIVERLLVAERLSRLAPAGKTAAIGIDGQLRREEQLGEAAMTILLSGDRRAKLHNSVCAAQEDYVCVMQVFPNTVWAKSAAVRLAALKP